MNKKYFTTEQLEQAKTMNTSPTKQKLTQIQEKEAVQIHA